MAERPKTVVWGVLGVAVVLGLVAWVWQERLAPESVTIEVWNKIILDEENVREDDVALYLTSSPDCIDFSVCGVEGQQYLSGDELNAVCQVQGLERTNRVGDTPNPENYDSTLWYGIAEGNRFGYVSEVWILPDHRGGRRLRECGPKG